MLKEMLIAEYTFLRVNIAKDKNTLEFSQLISEELEPVPS